MFHRPSTLNKQRSPIHQKLKQGDRLFIYHKQRSPIHSSTNSDRPSKKSTNQPAIAYPSPQPAITSQKINQSAIAYPFP
ncbi:MAG: hypothetical protein ACK47D_05435 [Pseudanabaena sp.]